jgi:hypothetical protein
MRAAAKVTTGMELEKREPLLTHYDISDSHEIVIREFTGSPIREVK